RVIVLDVAENRLNFCRQQLKVAHTVQAQGDILNAVQSITGGDLPTAVFDATGNPESMQRSFQYVSHGGRLIYVGLFQGDVTFHDPDFHRRELTLLSTRHSMRHEFTRI